MPLQQILSIGRQCASKTALGAHVLLHTSCWAVSDGRGGGVADAHVVEVAGRAGGVHRVAQQRGLPPAALAVRDGGQYEHVDH